jgi:signal transduction histidine kinase
MRQPIALSQYYSLELVPDTVRRPLLTSIAYFLGAEAAFLIGTLSDQIFAPFWPPNIILFCALLGARYEDWWRYVLAVLPAHIFAELQVGMDWPQLLVAFLTNCAVALLNASAIKWVLGGGPWLNTFRRALIFVVIAAGVGPAVVAFFGAYVRIYGGEQQAYYWLFWMQWYMANALGNLTLAPLFLSLISAGREDTHIIRPRLRWVEKATISIGVLISCAIAARASFYSGHTGLLPTLLYLPLLFVFWGTVRFGVRGASLALLVLTLTSIWVNLSGPTTFSASTAEDNVLALQIFLSGLAVPVLLFGAHIDGAKRKERRSRALSQMILRSNEQNQRKVAGDLHEGVCQDLVATYLRARQLFKLLPPETKSEAAAIEEDLLQAIGALRDAAYGMYPPLLVDGGLEPALRSFLHTYSERTGITVALQLSSDIGRLTSDAENVAFRIVEEALTNIEKHSISGTAQVTLSRGGASGDGLLKLRIEDPAPSTPRRTSVLSWLRSLAPSSAVSGLGTAAMAERIDTIGGRLNIYSIGGSTVVEATFPDVQSR